MIFRLDYLNKLLFPVILVLITAFICFQNYLPNTFLSGWDTIHPEFNFLNYFDRIINVWQQHQGLGAPPSQAHGAELPRLLVYYLSSFIFNTQQLRYSYFFLTLIIGPLGVYFFAKDLLEHFHLTESSKQIISFISGLTYLLNLATLQHYYVPLEMFATHYATLGWLFYFSTKFLLKNKNKDLILFSVFTIFASPMAHTPTLFYIFLPLFFIYLFLTAFFIDKKLIKKAILLIFITLSLNLYWMLPNTYYILHYGQAETDSKINTEFSDRAVQVAKNFGNLKDTGMLKSFLFDWGEFDEKSGAFVNVFTDWQTHLEDPLVNIIGETIFAFALIGIIISIKKKSAVGMAILPIFLTCFFFIANDNIFYQIFSDFLETHLPIVKEALRFPFTKFSVLLLFSYCVYFAYTLGVLIDFLCKKWPKKENSKIAERSISIFLLLIISLVLVYYVKPMFKGHLINSKMRTQIPQEYFDLFKWSDSIDISQRIANFPVNTFWAWSYYNFGYEGAGFTWFGIRQPLLNREFDRWIPYNENFFWEVSYATYSGNLPLLEKVLDKYQISWLLFDGNIIDSSSPKSINKDQFVQLISNSQKISFYKSFGNIKLYKVNNSLNSNQFISLTNSLPQVNPVYKKNNLDQGFLERGHYTSNNDQTKLNKSNTFYPFRSFFSNERQENLEYQISETQRDIIFTKIIPDDFKKYNLNIPNLDSEKLIWYDPQNLTIQGYVIPIVSYNGRILTVKIPKIKSLFSHTIDPTKQQIKEMDCNNLKTDSLNKISKHLSVENLEEDNKSFIRLKATLADNCSAQFLIPTLPHKFSYLITVNNRNVKSTSLLFMLENTDFRKTEIETYLPKNPNWNTAYFVQPPLDEFGQGYYLHFDNWAFNSHESVNDLGEISVYPIPYNFLSELSFSNQQIQDTPPIVSYPIDVYHKSQSYYKIKLIGQDQNDTIKNLILFQAFDNGWFAFSLDGLKIKPVGEHVLVDNWANGWVLNSKGQREIYIIFLPQLLEFFGFGILVATFYILFFGKFTKILRVFFDIFSKLIKIVFFGR